MNIESAYQILNQLHELGVRTICLCPGARNAPFVEILKNQKAFEVLTFYDERSAGFFALGRARRDEQPVVVCTTSGTAVSELVSPVIEAFYQKQPLYILSADRPKRLRGSGAPQAIEQYHLFEKHVEKTWDISAGDRVQLSGASQSPLHINICFDEPLIDAPLESFELKTENAKSVNSKERWDPLPSLSLESALIVVSQLNTIEKKSVEKALEHCQAPLFLEASSGLRNSKTLAPKNLLGGEKLVSQLLKSGAVKNVLRIGDVPVGRFWRDLDQLEIPTYSLTRTGWKGTERANVFVTNLSALDLSSFQIHPWDSAPWLKKSHELEEKIQGLLHHYPRSEPYFFKKGSENFRNLDLIYLGNSLPVRLWDLTCHQGQSVVGNRGVNGIDGQLSSALGQMKPGSSNLVVLGDLTTLYDFSGFWMSSYLREKEISVQLVVVNNYGGQIFSRIFDNELFLNQHQLQFEPLAKMWGWNYQKLDDPSDIQKTSGLTLSEWVPNKDQTNQFWEKYDQLWR